MAPPVFAVLFVNEQCLMMQEVLWFSTIIAPPENVEWHRVKLEYSTKPILTRVIHKHDPCTLYFEDIAP